MTTTDEDREQLAEELSRLQASQAEIGVRIRRLELALGLGDVPDPVVVAEASLAHLERGLVELLAEVRALRER